MRLLWLALVVNMLGACLDISEQQSAREKFITFVQTSGHVNFRSSLLHKVHNPTITIRYGFIPECAGKYSDAQVTSDIERVIRLWLQPLQDWEERLASDVFVDAFSFVKGTPYRDKPDGNNGGYMHRFSVPQGSELDIIFYCNTGRSYMRPYTSPMQIHLYDNMAGSDTYLMSTLVHEVGHVFGLADTYVDATGLTGGPGRYNVSTCGSKDMVGCQPLAIMNITRWLIEDNSNLLLGADDVAGIRWLYRYIVTGDVQCPIGYVSERSTGGCVPEDLLTFALQQGDYDSAIELMIEKRMPLDTQDKDGNTILHYAAKRAAGHGGHAYTRAVEAGASPDLKNNAGETPREILFPAIEEAMRREKIHIAQDLMARAID